jgi:hypothetical protein
MKLEPVPRVPASAFSAGRLPGRPSVVRGVSQDWPALHHWTPEHLKSVAGNVRVDVREAEGAPCNVYQNLLPGGAIRLGEYLDWVVETATSLDLVAVAQSSTSAAEISNRVAQSGFERSYYLDVDLASLSDRLRHDVIPPSWYGSDPVRVLLWCGVLGTSCGLHADVTPNCNVQVSGRKHFVLFHPSETPRLYRQPRSTHCRFDPNAPDYESFPLARRTHGMECTLEPGEALYIPVGWYHQVTVVTPWAINVNFFWPRPFPQGILTPHLWSLLLRRLRARFVVKANWMAARLRDRGRRGGAEQLRSRDQSARGRNLRA